MASPVEDRAIDEIVRGVIKRRKRMKDDVSEMCNLLSTFREDFADICGKYHEAFDRGCSAIYLSLKLHLAFHCGSNSVLGHEELSKLGRDFKPEERDKVPGEEDAVDPVSKLVEIVSNQLLSSKGAVTVGNHGCLENADLKNTDLEIRLYKLGSQHSKSRDYLLAGSWVGLIVGFVGRSVCFQDLRSSF